MLINFKFFLCHVAVVSISGPDEIRTRDHLIKSVIKNQRNTDFFQMLYYPKSNEALLPARLSYRPIMKVYDTIICDMSVNALVGTFITLWYFEPESKPICGSSTFVFWFSLP